MVAILVLLIALPGPAPMRPVPAHQAQQPPMPFEMREMNEAESAALPPGEGRDAVAFMCVPCHGVLPAVAVRKTAVGWSATVEDMRVKGAKGSDVQAEAAAKYLATFFAAVDVNKATAAEIVQVTGLTNDDAQAIVAYRDAGHTFKSFTDVKKVPGLDAKRLAAAKPRIVYAPK
jgi:competence ComEA-like helix-hairpin-helix protein